MTSSEKFVVPFRISLKTSFMLNGALLFMYLGAFYWILIFDLNLLIKIIVLAALGIGFATHLRQYLLRNSSRAISAMVWEDQDVWRLETTTGETIAVRLLGSSYAGPWMIVLNFRPESGGRMRSVVVMPDSVDSTTFRRLSVKLRAYGGEAIGEGS